MAFMIQGSGGSGGIPQISGPARFVNGRPANDTARQLVALGFDPSSGQGYGQFLANLQQQQTSSGGGQLTDTEKQAISAHQKNQQTANEQEKARFEKMMGLAEQFGAGQTMRNEQLRRQELAAGTSDLINRGLYNSSGALAVRENANNAFAQRSADIADRQIGMQLGILGDVQTRGPDMGLIAQLFGQKRADVALPLLQQSPVTLFPTASSGAAGSTQVVAGGKKKRKAA
ncbi:hypothetical protein [Fontivita pretiosa]|uniref:hypothetical protein n=1 Tax=Fontivita pretiosa TaxID=2989684 RepID=UPI003D1714C2